ncbi:MAG: helix-turn-helix domain-containing protein [Patescibacteria group bacterium]
MRGNFLYSKLGKRVCDFRRKNGLTQEEAAHRCGIDRTYLARIEAGKVNPTVKVLFNIARVMGTKIMNLMRIF